MSTMTAAELQDLEFDTEAERVLLWESGTRTLRLEADISKEEALHVAASVD